MGEPSMKWLFLLLVISNLGVFGWFNLVAVNKEAAAEPVYAPPVSQKILTLSEVPKVVKKPEPTVKEIEFKAVEEELREITEAFEQLSSIDADQMFCPHIEFEKEQDKRAFLPQIDALGWQYVESKMEGQRQKFWLYISAPDTREQANRIVRALKVRSVDSFIINRGEMKNRISLGLYSVALTAEKERLRISDLSGFDVRVFPHLRKVPLSVIEISQGINESEWKKFISQINFGKMMIKLEKNPC
ncbi:SPOR domain-containing protein [Marinomonas sp. PE14-40]|uniref:SPOR domain-containing protein n=1 Tax=Marinomonas sp. PE14-40 TaxID=3060621 RepID=UPI003F680FC3